ACWAIYVAFGASVLRRHSPLRTTAWTVLFGSLFMLPLGAWQLAESAPRTLTIATPLAVLYAGLISIGLGNVIYSRGVQIVGPTRTANLQFLVPATLYDAGLMGSREVMRREIDVLPPDPAAIDEIVAAQPHDPSFAPFARRARAAGIPVEIVSDGFGFFIEPAMRRLGVAEAV